MLVLVTLLTEQGVLCLQVVDGSFKLFYVCLLALSRVLSRKTVTGLTSFETSLALLVARLSASVRVRRLRRGGYRGRRVVEIFVIIVVNVIGLSVGDLSLLAARTRFERHIRDFLLDGGLWKSRGGCHR